MTWLETKKGRQDEMRRSPQDSGRLSAPILLLVALCMLFILLTPVASALGSAKESNDAYLAVSVMCNAEDGKVTDNDGIIGNSQSGADHAEAPDRFANGIQDGALPDSPLLPDEAGNGMGSGNADGLGDNMPSPGNGARGMDGAGADNGNMIGESGTADDGNSSGILPWIIAAIVAVSIVLVILALIPRKNKSR